MNQTIAYETKTKLNALYQKNPKKSTTKHRAYETKTVNE